MHWGPDISKVLGTHPLCCVRAGSAHLCWGFVGTQDAGEDKRTNAEGPRLPVSLRGPAGQWLGVPRE